jgi:hypothetical protein
MFGGSFGRGDALSFLVTDRRYTVGAVDSSLTRSYMWTKRPDKFFVERTHPTVRYSREGARRNKRSSVVVAYWHEMACIHLFPNSTADFLLFFAPPPNPKAGRERGAGLPRYQWPAIIYCESTYRRSIRLLVPKGHTHKRRLECCWCACARHKDSRSPHNWNSMTDPRAREMVCQLSFKFHYTTFRFLRDMRAVR